MKQAISTLEDNSRFIGRLVGLREGSDADSSSSSTSGSDLEAFTAAMIESGFVPAGTEEDEE